MKNFHSNLLILFLQFAELLSLDRNRIYGYFIVSSSMNVLKNLPTEMRKYEYQIWSEKYTVMLPLKSSIYQRFHLD